MMKKGSYLTTGIVIGMALTMTTPVLAETVKTISAKINSTVGVLINGKETKLNTQPITYNNLNYLPVGEIGRALGYDVSYDKSTDTIHINNKGASVSSTTTATPESIPSSQPVDVVQKVSQGESIAKDGITSSINKIEFVTQKEKIDGLVLDKGFKVYVSVTNNSDYALTPGMRYVFSTGNDTTDKDLNSMGAVFSFTTLTGERYTGDPLTKGEGISGFIFFSYDKEVKINEISYFPNFVGKLSTNLNPMGTWSFN
ncbi:stalk domain-containing protein [Paenibacillus tianjinensis]|uniref:Copper amine oxidase-like N-terminal domain-containing protein n=1 Tax=Paenibacillus tianjinensis TaxID=2810347 RepID=A0ABX7L5B5_9BACL|nr:stalk domain-containing protein [Paenibacillus tianjinensis]QSF43250.1 hypothetical protein JRJ22_18460 [Paenibacillus tianjinensis]